MNSEDIIRMARECFADPDGSLVLLTPELSRPELSRFAALVAAAEREECAKLCLEEAPSLDGQLCADAIRDAIRARGGE